MSLEDIWAEPIVETIAGPSKPEEAPASGSSRARRALFLSDSEDDDVGNDVPARRRRRASDVGPKPASPAQTISAPRGPEKAQLDLMFSGLDDDDDNDPFDNVAPAVDLESLKRQADARVAAAGSAIPSASTSTPSFGSNAARDKDRDKGDKGRNPKRVVAKMDAERYAFRWCLYFYIYSRW